MSDDIQARREAAAARYNFEITDSMGRKHPSLIRRGILSGQFDGGSICDITGQPLSTRQKFERESG